MEMVICEAAKNGTCHHSPCDHSEPHYYEHMYCGISSCVMSRRRVTCIPVTDKGENEVEDMRIKEIEKRIDLYDKRTQWASEFAVIQDVRAILDKHDAQHTKVLHDLMESRRVSRELEAKRDKREELRKEVEG